jgi:hypothetical protein
MNKMKKGQKYVVRCHKKVKASKVGLGSNTFLPGTYITYNGNPTTNINEAHVYLHEIEFEEFDFENTVDFFSPVPVRLSEEKKPNT